MEAAPPGALELNVAAKLPVICSSNFAKTYWSWTLQARKPGDISEKVGPATSCIKV